MNRKYSEEVIKGVVEQYSNVKLPHLYARNMVLPNVNSVDLALAHLRRLSCQTKNILEFFIDRLTRD